MSKLPQIKEKLQTLKGLRWYGAIFLITLSIVFLVRVFLVQSYTVSSSEMETALLRGDRLLVNKTTYGIRLPVTVLSIPFTFDKFWGLKSYSDLIEFDYHRIFYDPVKRNDIVLFNNPLEMDKPLDKRSLTLSRCVATPGDTIRVEGNDLFINGKKYLPSPDLLISFRYKKEKQDSVASAMSLFNVPVRHARQDSTWGYVSLNRYEMYIINQKLSLSSQLEEDKDSEKSYSIIVPAKGMSLSLNSFNAKLYGTIISQEAKAKENIKLENSQVQKDGISLKSYQFTEDYYWFISDNPDEALDSRALGFISEKYIIGKASSIWFSFGKEGFRWDRFFTTTNK